MIHLRDKNIVVTGGSGLLGRAFVKGIAEAGAVAISADIAKSDALADFIQLTCDITDPASVKSTLTHIQTEYGPIHGWINNAYPRTPDWGKQNFEEESMKSWAKNVDLHLNSYTQTAQQVLSIMKAQGFGSFINISSIYGILGPDFTIYEGTKMNNPSAYAAIKGGLVNLTRYLAAYFGPNNVRVNAISPGGIWDHQPQSFVDAYEKKTPLKRMGKPDDIVPAAVFLLSDGASYISGHNLVVDGGWSVV